MKWNPGRVPRGTAVFGLLVARDGVWIGSDTDYIGINPAYKRQKLAFFPYQGGYTATATTTPTLPATVYVGRGTAGAATNVSSWGFDGTTAGTETTSGSAIDWSTDPRRLHRGEQAVPGHDRNAPGAPASTGRASAPSAPSTPTTTPSG